MKIYVVCGVTGEYSDRYEWLTRAFVDEKVAQLYITTLENTYRTFSQDNCGYQRETEEMEELNRIMRELDPKFDEDYTGTQWFIRDVEMSEDTL